jgi:hypothetical protein
MRFANTDRVTHSHLRGAEGHVASQPVPADLQPVLEGR